MKLLTTALLPISIAAALASITAVVLYILLKDVNL